MFYISLLEKTEKDLQKILITNSFKIIVNKISYQKDNNNLKNGSHSISLIQ